MPHLQKFGFFGRSDRYHTRLEETSDLPKPVFVTAASHAFYRHSLAVVSDVQRLFPDHRILYYDLGLDVVKEVHAVRRMCNVEYRRFPFESYPSYVSDLKQYRWKCLLIAVTVVVAMLDEDSSAYKYFPTVIENLKSTKAQMFDAALMLVVRTKEVVEDILSW
ncbi:unnamed protein product [Soboliphyme baturini]|uniref:DUF577 domain-containing protein n=1 Tax=Soboliphyme baturini TaxID=241478 RepID=A0A183IZF2_9BILA|nr:unnamed protein product [Soboliphyme baturini]